MTQQSENVAFFFITKQGDQVTSHYFVWELLPEICVVVCYEKSSNILLCVISYQVLISFICYSYGTAQFKLYQVCIWLKHNTTHFAFLHECIHACVQKIDDIYRISMYTRDVWIIICMSMCEYQLQTHQIWFTCTMVCIRNYKISYSN